MLSKISAKSIVINLIYLMIGAALSAALLLAWINGPSQSAQAAESTSPQTFQVKDPNSPSNTWGTCTPVAVATLGNRVHVECSPYVGSFRFFATPTSDPANAARVLSVLQTAYIAGRTISIEYDPLDDTSGPAFSCAASDCRPIISAGIGQ